jgi:signal peptidase I
MADRNPGVPPHSLAAGSPPVSASNSSSNGATRLARQPAARPGSSKQQPETKDSLREVVETVVFVVVLVLMLKSFVAEAFVIPTGSMATTLYGYQKTVKCPKCGLEFPVNCSQEVDPAQPPPTPVIGCICPGCRYHIDFREENMHPSCTTGDRVLVAKFPYDLDIAGKLNRPERYQVVVFKYPNEPQRNFTPLNYIKRLIGLPGETIAIYYGKLYVYQGPELQYPGDSNVPPLELWHSEYMHTDDAKDTKAAQLFRDGKKFLILRKPPRQVLAVARLVYDNDHQAKDLIGKVAPRWSADSGWSVNDQQAPTTFEYQADQKDQLSWLHYHNLVPPLRLWGDNRRRDEAREELITDFMGYNTWEPEPGPGAPPHSLPPQNWVGDLMEEFDLEVTNAQGELVLELSKGVDRFQARWDLAVGKCTLVRLNHGKETVLDSKDTSLNKPGKYHIRFANVDERLLVWVGSSLPFGDGVDYSPPSTRGPTEANDLRAPASIGVRGAGLKVSHLKLWRDTYYTANLSAPDAGVVVDLSNPTDWTSLHDLPVRTYYVQPDHYLCLGDNSPESSDGRSWGLVPKRLLLGRAMVIYYPFSRIRLIE